MSAAPLKAVLFDLDGTLLDTAPEFAVAVNALLARHQRPPQAYARLRECVSDGTRGMVQSAFALHPDAAEFEPLRLELLDLYAQQLGAHTQMFEGMAQVLEFIEAQGLAWGVVTNKPQRFAQPLMARLKLATRCAALICPEHVATPKPDPAALWLACQQMGCASAGAIYIGDHRRDIEAGRNAGMPTIACAFGYVHAEDPCSAWGADWVVDTARAIIPIVQQRLN